MKRRLVIMLTAVAVFGLLVAPSAFAADKIVIGHAAPLSGKYAKAAEQSTNGIKAAVAWINDTRGGVNVGDKKLMIEYKVYDCESKKESVTSLLERLITRDKVNFTMTPYSSGLTLAGAPIA